MKCFGQQTNSTPENNEIPHGKSIAKLRICMFLSWHAAAPVWFHRTNGQQREALWIWSNRQPSGTSNASDWNGPSWFYVMWMNFSIHDSSTPNINKEIPKQRYGLIQRWVPLHLDVLAVPDLHHPPIFW